MIAPRLKELIQILQENPNSFARKLGVSASSIYNIIGKRGSRPSYEILEQIKKIYPQVDMNWLLSGEDQPLREIQLLPEVSVKVVNFAEKIQQIQKLEVSGEHPWVLQNEMNGSPALFKYA
jgi:hypothetical protein